jgi:cation diffusion facilitator family transporter
MLIHTYVRDFLQVTWRHPKRRRLLLYFIGVAAFMCVEFTVGVASNSLGLVSDAFHMLVDSFSIFVGLLAAYVAAAWGPSEQHPAGFGRYELLSAFLNGVLLVVVSLRVLVEASMRAWHPQPIATGALLPVSVAGLLLNVVGVMFFHDDGHGHGHSHGGGGGSGHGGSACCGHACPSPKKHRKQLAAAAAARLALADGAVGTIAESDRTVGGAVGRTPDEGRGGPRPPLAHRMQYGHPAAHAPSTPPAAVTSALPPPVGIPFSSVVSQPPCGSGCATYHHHPQGCCPPSVGVAAAGVNSGANTEAKCLAVATTVPGATSPSSPTAGAATAPVVVKTQAQLNMEGVYLHILADLLGSLAVVVSTLLVQWTGWYIFDAICAVAVSGLILMAARALIRTSAASLILADPTLPVGSDLSRYAAAAVVESAAVGVRTRAQQSAPTFHSEAARIAAAATTPALAGAILGLRSVHALVSIRVLALPCPSPRPGDALRLVPPTSVAGGAGLLALRRRANNARSNGGVTGGSFWSTCSTSSAEVDPGDRSREDQIRIVASGGGSSSRSSDGSATSESSSSSDDDDDKIVHFVCVRLVCAKGHSDDAVRCDVRRAIERQFATNPAAASAPVSVIVETRPHCGPHFTAATSGARHSAEIEKADCFGDRRRGGNLADEWSPRNALGKPHLV